MRSIKLLLSCSVIVLISMGQSQGAGTLLPELACSSLRRVVANRIVLPTKALLQRRFYSSSIRHPQVYGVAAYDALFKYVLSDDKIRPSFFHAFIPNLPIIASERLDNHMNPVQSPQLLRDFLHSKDTGCVVKGLTPVSDFEVIRRDSVTQNLVRDDNATAFLHEMVSRYAEMKRSFPRTRRDGTMDFVCQLANDDYALVKIQIIPENYWDRRALAYVAAFYGNQLFKRGEWKHIRKVIGVNILGGGRNNKIHWVDTPTQFVRHYKVQEQLHASTQSIDGIELIQYSLMNAPKVSADQELLDWITFFKEGQYMSEEQVQQRIKTSAVLEAFKRTKIKSLPAEVLETYEAEDKEYDRYSDPTQNLVLQDEVKTLMVLINKGKITLDDVMQSDDYSGELKKEEDAREHVKAAYAEIAKEEKSCFSCSAGGCGGGTSAQEYGLALGYSPEELAEGAIGADLGLGCGNPGAIAALKPGEVVIDLGSGGGFDCFLAAKKVGESGRVIGVDMTPEMIALATKNAAKTEYRNVTFLLGKIEALPVENSIADVIISNCVVNLSPNKEAVFSEAARVLKIGGRLAISDIVTSTELPEAIKQDVKLYTGCITGATKIDTLHAILERAGFGEIRIEVKPESRSFISKWAPGSGAEDFIASAYIHAIKGEHSKPVGKDERTS